MAAGTPLRWRGRNTLIWVGSEDRIVLHSSPGEVTTLVLALRSIRQHGHDRSMLGDAAELLHQVMDQLGASARSRHIALAGGDVSLLPPVIAADGRPGSPVREAVLGAVRDERALRFRYTASDGARTARDVWPAGVTHHGMCLLAFCTLRQAFRTFRIDQIATPEIGPAMPKPRVALLRDWRQSDPVGAATWDVWTGELAEDAPGQNGC